MKVLVVLPTLASGGTTRIVMSVAQRLVAGGWTVSLATLFPAPDGPLSPVIPGMRHIALVPRGRRRPFAALTGLVRLARSHDVVLAAQEVAATNYGWLASLIARRPFISWTHIAYERLAPLLPPGHDGICRFVYRRIDRVVFPSQGAADSLARALQKASPAGWSVIPNFVEPHSLGDHAWKSEWEAWFEAPVVLTVARMAHQKALDRLIRAHRALLDRGIDHHLVIAGSGPERPMLEAEVARLGVGASTFFAGHVDDPTTLYQRATVFGMCSRFEGLPMTLLEAMTAGLPVVAMDCESGPREVLDGGRAGILTPDGDEPAFTDALAQLLTDATARRHYAAAGQARAAEYTPQRVMPQWEALLSEVAGRSRSRSVRARS